jgi:hypothetical protein
MKKVIIAILVILAAALSISAYQNNPKTIVRKLDIARLGNQSKQLVYKVYFLGIFPLGEAVLEDNGLVRFEGKDLYLLSAQANAGGFISRLHPFSASLESYLETRTFLPVIFRQELRTKDKEIVKEARYDQANNIMEIAGQRRSILLETYEPLSALYRLRSLDLEKVSNFDLNVNTNQKNYCLTGDITKEDIRLKDSTVKVYRLKGKIFRRDKNPYHQSQVEFVLLGNEQRTPVFIKVFASGALITARLIERGN